MLIFWSFLWSTLVQCPKILQHCGAKAPRPGLRSLAVPLRWGFQQAGHNRNGWQASGIMTKSWHKGSTVVVFYSFLRYFDRNRITRIDELNLVQSIPTVKRTGVWAELRSVRDLPYNTLEGAYSPKAISCCGKRGPRCSSRNGERGKDGKAFGNTSPKEKHIHTRYLAAERAVTEL